VSEEIRRGEAETGLGAPEEAPVIPGHPGIATERVAEIRGNIRIYDNRVAERDVRDLLSAVAALTQERDRLRDLLREAIDAFEHIDCGNAQCNDRWGGCDRRCALHARAAQAHFTEALAALTPEPQAEAPAPDAEPSDAEMLDWLESHWDDATFDLSSEFAEYDEESDAVQPVGLGLEEDDRYCRIEYVYKHRGRTICAETSGKTIRDAIRAAMKEQGR
jgi:hypothetical protein